MIVGAWALGLAALLLAPTIAVGGNELASIIPADSPAIQAELHSVEKFGYPLSSRTAIIQRDPDGLSVYTQAESVLAALALDQRTDLPWPLLGAIPITNARRLGTTAGESNTAVLTYLFMNPVSSFSHQSRAAQRYIDEYLNRPEDHVIGITGSVPARAAQAQLVSQTLPRLEQLTVLAILLLVGLTFRSVVAPLVALGAAGIAFVATTRISSLLGGVLGFAAPTELEPLLVALLLGVVTDYTIFYVTALQVRLRDDPDPHTAVRGAVAAYTPIVVAAGLTVAGGTAALLAATSPFYRGFGPAMALAVVAGLAVSVTLVPALMAILGRKMLWPGLAFSGRDWAGSRMVAALRTRIAALHLMEHLTRRKVAAAVAAACLALLVVVSIPITRMDLGVGFTTSLPPDNPVARSAAAASAAFAPGITSTTAVLLEGSHITEHLAELSDLQKKVEKEPGVAGVVGPAQNFTQRAHNVVLSQDGSAARMLVVLDHDPLDAVAIDDFERLSSRLPQMAADSGLAWTKISIGGDTALADGLVSSTGTDLVRIAIAGIVVNLLLLVIFLRALVAPLYLLMSSILALTASLGLTVWVFMDLLGKEGLTFYVPFAVAVLLVSLGSDYNIFGVGNVWEHARVLPLREAITTAMPESARAITTAGLTLAVSFGMLATIPLSPFRELAFAMTVGILIDAFVVRTLLMPSLLVLFGPMSGWPGPNLRLARQRSRDADALDVAATAGSNRSAPSPT